jgi:hypothetical protein
MSEEGVEDTPEDSIQRGVEVARIEAWEEESYRRRMFYVDVESMIAHGVLTHTLPIDGVDITFRSMPYDAWHRCQARARNSSYKFAQWYLAESIYMIDGMVVADDPAATHAIYQNWVVGIPLKVLRQISSVPNGLNTRVDRALRLVEAFCYEPYSRAFRFRNAPESDNPVRTAWASYVHADNHMEEDITRWAHTAAIVGAMAGAKAARHIHTSIERQQTRERQRRDEVIEKAINSIIIGLVQSPPLTVVIDGQTYDVPVIGGPKTFDDLFEEMHKSLSNRLDSHDKIVAEYKKGIRQRMEESRGEMQNAFRTAIESESPTPLVGMTPEQLMQHDPHAFNPKRYTSVDASHEGRLYDKYLSDDIRVGGVGKSGPEPISRPTNPNIDLAEVIHNRKPTLNNHPFNDDG